jgi:dimethylamine monooxygenase subunit C
MMPVGIMDLRPQPDLTPGSRAEMRAFARCCGRDSAKLERLNAAVQRAPMPVPTILSRPQYKPFELMPAGRAHLIICERAESEPHLAPSSWADPPVELWTVVSDSGAMPVQSVEPGFAVRHFRSTAHLLEQLSYRLAREHVGLHLYAIGSEPFIWDVATRARQFGMDRDEYHLTQHGSERRRVYCVHCRTMTEGVSTNIAVCAGCGAHLQVRDHFSKRLAAFMGVQIDAEIPGAIPEIEEVYI